jgi:hypothetical protein
MDIQGYGLKMRIPDGWDGRIYQQSPQDAVTLEATSARLAPVAEDSVLQTEQGMGNGDVYIRLSDIGAAPPYVGKDSDWRVVSSPPAIRPTDFQEFVEGHSLPAGTASAMVIKGRAFMVYVGFGSWPSPAAVGQLNQILGQLQVDPGPARTGSS